MVASAYIEVYEPQHLAVSFNTNFNKNNFVLLYRSLTLSIAEISLVMTPNYAQVLFYRLFILLQDGLGLEVDSLIVYVHY